MKGQLSHILREYFDEHESSPGILNESFLSFSTCAPPVVPVDTSGWEIVTDPRRFMKRYEFNSPTTLISFVNEVLEYQESISHHAKLTINHREVIIEVHTHDVNDITEIDQEFAKVADEIYLDVLDYEGEGERTYDIRF